MFTVTIEASSPVVVAAGNTSSVVSQTSPLQVRLDHSRYHVVFYPINPIPLNRAAASALSPSPQSGYATGLTLTAISDRVKLYNVIFLWTSLWTPALQSSTHG
jgi:hypothetical protein